ncbi:hypothetical protein CBI38_34100 (plasmid) [Rhodococcus oxybenzonivorans]|uniref:Uncharacterized protein n=1 Tax=Rhodococcus oxybenzonivorans TaxID=1990687 RepID=A0A2S2C6F8_9NOCA|nr:hypothetical protein CBI38_34100 [Rhodococcus oxybenzonivorans]
MIRTCCRPATAGPRHPPSIAGVRCRGEQSFPAVAGFAVAVLVHTLDAETGRLRHLPPAEPAEWARAIFSTIAQSSHRCGPIGHGRGDMAHACKSARNRLRGLRPHVWRQVPGRSDLGELHGQ